jgi:hypothetical protein
MTRSVTLREWYRWLSRLNIFLNRTLAPHASTGVETSLTTEEFPFDLELLCCPRFDYAPRTTLVAPLSARLLAQGGRITS